uniref:ETS domain-containing protein n=1 Tax=Callithrix jacchus TaxID=9483 RepID=A0A5F4VYA4_CALJA
MESAITPWQFLLDQKQEHLICRTSNDGEFTLLEAEEVAKLWGLRKNKTNTNSDELSRALAQTPNGLLLTPSPVLSSMHFCSSLSPVAPLSPARLQGPGTLFQFPTLLSGHMPVPIPSLDSCFSSTAFFQLSEILMTSGHK